MVYNGPSKGCRRCRDRKVKCDQGQPACLNCCTRGIDCPGYADIFDKAHRDETIKIRKRHSQQGPTTLALRASPTLDPRSVQISVPKSIAPDPEATALNFFFLCYCACQRVEETCSFFGLLPDMYAKSSVSSPLSRATAALALQVTHLHCSHGGTSWIGCNAYADAVILTKQALAAPAQAKSDWLLMTTLVLEAYESAKSTFGRGEKCLSRPRTHILGSVALLKQRGSLNYKDELSWRLVVATRNSLLHHTWHSMDELAAIEAVLNIWDRGNGTEPKGPAVEADTLAFRLSRLKLAAMTTPNMTHPRKRTDDSNNLKDIASHAIDIAGQCALWHNALPLAWRPASVPAHSLAQSIQVVCAYEHVAPTIYANISTANSINRHRTTELACLMLIHSCLADISSREDIQHGQHKGLPPPLMARVQVLVDEICASVPFLTGDVMVGELGPHVMLVPSVLQASSNGSRQSCTFSQDTSEHRQQVVVSGIYMMYRTLTTVLSTTQSIKDVLRDGQVAWIMGQTKRLKQVLHIS